MGVCKLFCQLASCEKRDEQKPFETFTGILSEFSATFFSRAHISSKFNRTLFMHMGSEQSKTLLKNKQVVLSCLVEEDFFWLKIVE